MKEKRRKKVRTKKRDKRDRERGRKATHLTSKYESRWPGKYHDRTWMAAVKGAISIGRPWLSPTRHLLCLSGLPRAPSDVITAPSLLPIACSSLPDTRHLSQPHRKTEPFTSLDALFTKLILRQGFHYIFCFLTRLHTHP